MADFLPPGVTDEMMAVNVRSVFRVITSYSIHYTKLYEIPGSACPGGVSAAGSAEDLRARHAAHDKPVCRPALTSSCTRHWKGI